MSHILRIFFVFLLLGIALGDGSAQTTGKKKFVKPVPEEEKTTETKQAETNSSSTKKPDPKKGDEPSKWGYGVNLGNIGFAGDAVNIGLDPNVAYRLDDNFAVGFMVKMNYYHAKYYDNLTYTSFDWGPTVFTRWKPLLNMEAATPFMQGIFLQAEFERSYVSREEVDEFGNLVLNDDGTKIQTIVNEEHYLYVGGGLSSGYPFSSFISFHYNILDNAELSRLPFTYRIGFTWNY
jgi:long-subunit fatty acid transport protein